MENKIELIPKILIYLRNFYNYSDCLVDHTYLDDRISYYELLLSFSKEIMITPPIPKNKLRRRNIHLF